MIHVTLSRGAQSGGVVSFTDGGGGGGRAVSLKSLRGVRVRVVNGKRTDLSQLIRAKLQRAVAGLRRQGLTLVHFSAQRKRLLWDRGCI